MGDPSSEVPKLTSKKFQVLACDAEWTVLGFHVPQQYFQLIVSFHGVQASFGLPLNRLFRTYLSDYKLWTLQGDRGNPKH